MVRIGKDESAVVRALAGGSASGPLRRLTADASQLRADAHGALANLPPACIPGVISPYRAAMTEVSEASADTLSYARDDTNGDVLAAIPKYLAANTAMNKAFSDLSAATAAVTAFTG